MPRTPPSINAPIISFVDSGLSSTDNITNNGTITVSGIATGFTWQYSLDSGLTWIAGKGSTFTLTGDGPKTVMVRQIDSSGYTSATSSLNLILDTTVSAPVIALSQDSGSSSADSITKDGTVVLSGLETGGTWQYSIDAGKTWINGSGASFTLTGDGAKSVLVRQTDLAGNLSVTNKISFTLDSTALKPVLTLSQDNGSSTSDGITNNGTVLVTGLENGGTWKYSLDQGLTWINGIGSSITLSGDGSKSVLVRQTDVAGNISADSVLNFTLDTIVAAPSVSLISDTGFVTNDMITANSQLNVAGFESGAKIEYSTNNGTSWSTNFSAAQGLNSVLVRQTDLAGNISNSTLLNFTFDSAAPTTPILSLVSDAGTSSSDMLTNNGALKIANPETGALIEYSIDNGTSWTQSFTAQEGINTVIVRQTDVAGNTSPTSSLTFTLDTKVSAPTVSLISDLGIYAGDNITTNAQLNISGTEIGSKVEYSTDNGQSWTENFSAVEGLNSVLIRQTDAAGNISNSTLVNFILDTTAPSAPNLSLMVDAGTSSSDLLTNSGTLNISNAEMGAIIEYSIDSGTTWTQSFTAQEGLNTVMVRQTDLAGNMSSASTITFTIDTTKPLDLIASLVSDSGMSSTDMVTNNSQLAILNTENGAKIEYSFNDGMNWSTTYMPQEGFNKVLIRQTDNAGNISNATSLSFTLDTLALAPTVNLASDSGLSTSDKITNSGALTVSGLENGAKVEYSIDNGSTWLGSFIASEGTNNVLIRQTDVVGNVSSATAMAFTLDTKATTPTVFLMNDTGVSSSDKITSNGTISISGLEAGANWQYSTNGGSSWTSGVASSFIITGDGVKSVLVRQYDLAGNISSNANLNFTLDTSTPTDISWIAATPPSETLLPGGTLANLTSVDGINTTGFVFGLATGSSSEFSVSSAGVVNFLGTSLGTNSTYNLSVEARDAAGNSFVKAFRMHTGDATANNLLGGASHEIFYGGDGNDSMNGAVGNDILFGQAGNDTLIGGAGRDRLIGGAGSDVFRFTATSDSSSLALSDTVSDFVSGVDKIDLSLIDAKTSTTADDVFKFVTSARSTVSANSVTWYQNTANKQTIIQADNTGDAVADFVLTLNGLLNLSSKDFVL
ncbi:MAG: hypothetical protein ACKOW3_05480 [Hyphomicrobium sp.]